MVQHIFYTDEFLLVKDKAFVEYFFENYKHKKFFRVSNSESIVITSKDLSKIICIIEYQELESEVIISGIYFFKEFNELALSDFFSKFTEQNKTILFINEDSKIGLGQLLQGEKVPNLNIIKSFDEQ